MSILIVTSRADSHADRLIRLLQGKANVFRWNTEGTNTETKIIYKIEECGAVGGSLSAPPFRSTSLLDIQSVWYRKPIFDFDFVSSQKNRLFATEETRSAIDSVFSLLDHARWVNDPFKARKSQIKAQQLTLAGALGVKVPRTLVTTDADTAVNFVRSCTSGAVAKTIYAATAVISGLPQAIPTQIVTVEDLENFAESIPVCPVQLQERIPKAYELRITVIGEQIFAARIESQRDDRTRVDWRPFCTLCEYSIERIPKSIIDFCLSFIARQGLEFGAIDMIVDEDGEYVFLENNPFGQYLWIEDETGMPLTEAMGTLLLARREGNSSREISVLAR